MISERTRNSYSYIMNALWPCKQAVPTLKEDAHKARLMCMKVESFIMDVYQLAVFHIFCVVNAIGSNITSLTSHQLNLYCI
jgi:hypothetical protein